MQIVFPDVGSEALVSINDHPATAYPGSVVAPGVNGVFDPGSHVIVVFAPEVTIDLMLGAAPTVVVTESPFPVRGVAS